MRAEFRVHGLPAPQGSKSGFINPKTGKVRMVEAGSSTGRVKIENWRLSVIEAARNWLDGNPERNDLPFTGPVVVELDFRFPLTKGDAYRLRHTTKPDLDKLIRGTFDALKIAGLFTDDAQVCRVVAAKRYARTALDPPGADVAMWSEAEEENASREALKAEAADARKREKAKPLGVPLPLAQVQ